MSETFSVGDVCEIVESALHPENVGRECTVTSAANPIIGWHGLLFYQIRLHDGSIHYATPECLRKKRPPPAREQTSTWDDLIVWRPKETEHV